MNNAPSHLHYFQHLALKVAKSFSRDLKKLIYNLHYSHPKKFQLIIKLRINDLLSQVNNQIDATKQSLF